MHTQIDICIIVICTIFVVGSYIYLKASGEMWYGINWTRVFYEIRRGICKLLLKLCNK